MAAISLNGVHKTYRTGLLKKKVFAVSDLSLEVASGEVYGLVGPNGAGKSSTIRMLLGLSRPKSGSVHIKGRPAGDREILKQIGYLPENPYLYDNLSLRNMLDFCARVSGLDGNSRKRRVDTLLEKLGMASVQNRPMRTYSKGMLQRAGICFALLHDPAIVILDEPMSGLDPIGRKHVFDIVMELKQQGKTIFFCSHILSDVERLCDRIGMLHQGRLVRTFESSDFSDEIDLAVHLRIGPLSPELRGRLVALGARFQNEGDQCLVSVAGDRVAQVAQNLNDQGVSIIASRSERISLEEKFIAAIQEGVQ